jgi:hypothetical protein
LSKKVLTPAILAAEMAVLDKAAADKRGAIEDGLVKQALATIDAQPANLTGLQSLLTVVNHPALASLPCRSRVQLSPMNRPG